MTELFDIKDLLTVATADQAEINTKGYFGDNLSNLIEKVRQGNVETLTDVIPDVTYCFESNNDLHYVFFLPADKKVKEPVYRPIKTIDELFNFLMTNFNKDNVYDSNGNKIKVDTNKKAEYLLGRKITLKGFNNQTKVTLIQDIVFSSDDPDGNIIYLNYLSLEYLFKNFEIKKGGKFVPFGVRDYNEN